MVCRRCILAVEQILQSMGKEVVNVELGEVTLAKKPSEKDLTLFNSKLQMIGFEVLDDQKMKVIEKIKTYLVQLVASGEIPDHFSLSTSLSRHLLKDYSTLTKLFSQVESITIEQFFIQQKIEKAKEWLRYDEIPVAEIALRLGYSNPSHLTNQFKKLTGLTPGDFKKGWKSS